MEAFIILFIISVQFSICFFGVKYLSELDHKIISLTEKVDEITPKIKPALNKARQAFSTINNFMEKVYKQRNKLKLIRNIMLLKSLVAAIILYKKRKNIFKFFSVYNIVSKFTKAIMAV